MRKIWTFVVLSTLILLSGCSTHTDEQTSHTPTAEATNSEPASVGVTVGEATVKLDANGKRYWEVREKTKEEEQQERLERWGLVGVPGVPPMDEVPFIAYDDDEGFNRNGCMADAGFPPIRHDDGSWENTATPGQENAFLIAHYRCELMYPDDPATIHPPMNESQVSYYYDWQIGPARTCYEEHGYPVGDPPSKQVFIDDWFDNMKFDTWFLGNYAPDDMEFVNKTCPWFPPDIWEH